MIMEPVAVPAQRLASPPSAMFTTYGPAPTQAAAGGLPPSISYGAAPMPMVVNSMSSYGLVARQPQAPLASPSSMVTMPMSQTAQPTLPVQSISLASPVQAVPSMQAAPSSSVSAMQSVAFSALAQTAPGSMQASQSKGLAAPIPMQNVLQTGQSMVITSQQQAFAPMDSGPHMAVSPAQGLQLPQVAGASPVAGSGNQFLLPRAAASGVYQPASYGQVMGLGSGLMQPSSGSSLAGSSAVQISGSGIAAPMAQAPVSQVAQTENVSGTVIVDSALEKAVAAKDPPAKKKSKKSGKQGKRCWCCD